MEPVIKDIKELETIDNGEFAKLFNREENEELFKTIKNVVLSEEDKYPRSIKELSGLPEVKLSRSRDKEKDQNVLRLFTGPKKKQVLVGQYSGKGYWLFKYDEDKDCDIDIYHHTDMDGDASASIIFNFIKANRITDSVYTYRYNYNGKTIDNLITRANIRASKTGRKSICVIVDISPKPVEMMNILNTYTKVIWIDHHQTSLSMVNSLKNIKETNEKFTYMIDTRCCATYLTLSMINATYDTSKLIYCHAGERLASVINVYDLKLDRKYPTAYIISKYFNQYYFDYKTLTSFAGFWKKAFYYKESENSVINKMVTTGCKLLEIENLKLKAMYENDFIYKYTLNIFNEDEEKIYGNQKLRVRAIYGMGNSARFVKHEDDGIPEIDMVIKYRGDELALVISAYTDDDLLGEVDLSKLMSKYNIGGGHKKACGCTLFTDDLYELVVSDTNSEGIDPEEWKFGNDSSYKTLVKVKPDIPSKMRFKNWKLDEMKDIINSDTVKDIWERWSQDLLMQRPNYFSGSADVRVEYEIDQCVQLFTKLYAFRLYKYLINKK